MILKPKLITKIEPGHLASKGLVGSWLFNEGGGTLAYDTSGNGNHGTLVTNTHSVAGKFGSALSFDEGDDYVDTGNGSSLKPTSITVCLWAYAIVGNGTPASSSSSFDTPPYTWNFYIGAGGDNGLARIELDTTGSPTSSAYGTTNILGAWHYLCLTYDNSTGEGILYVDSINEVSLSLSGDLDYHAAAKTYIGSRQDNSSYALNGLIDSVLIYNRSLSADEIASLYLDPFQMFKGNL